MRFKGFWTELWNLTKHSFEFLKDYWLLYTIVCLIVSVACGFATLLSFGFYSKFEDKKIKEDKNEYEDFLK